MSRVIHLIAGLSTGGAEMMLLKLLEQHSARKQMVICLKDERNSYVAKQLISLGIECHFLNISGIFSAPMALLKIRKILAGMPDTVILAWMYYSALYSVLFKLFGLHGRIIWNIRHSVHDIKTETWKIKIAIKLCALLSFIPVKVIYNSKVSLKQHIELGFSASNACYIPNGFNESLFRPDSELRKSGRLKLNLSNENLVFGLVARYHPMKGHKVFIEAAAIFSRECPEARFIFVGSGVNNANKELTEFIQAHNVQDKFLLLGEKSFLHEITPIFDVAVSASLWGEGFSNAIGEAMCCGVPCIATEIGDSASIIGDTGFLIPSQSVSDLLHALRHFCAIGIDGRNELGVRARDRMISQFSIEKIAEEYEHLY